MNQLTVENFLFQEETLSIGRAAMLCCMVHNDLDDALVSFLAQKNMRAVITRAGGSGDNLKSKLLRNSFGAAEKSGLLAVSPRNRYAIAKLVEEVMRSIDSPIINVAGGGLKIGIVVKGNDIAMGVFGNLGIPGTDVDYEISVSRTLNHYLEN